MMSQDVVYEGTFWNPVKLTKYFDGYSFEECVRAVEIYYPAGVPMKKIVGSYCSSYEEAYRAVKALGLRMRRGKYNGRGRLTPSEKLLILKMYYVDGMSKSAIAKELGRGVSTVAAFLGRYESLVEGVSAVFRHWLVLRNPHLYRYYVGKVRPKGEATRKRLEEKLAEAWREFVGGVFGNSFESIIGGAKR